MNDLSHYGLVDKFLKESDFIKKFHISSETFKIPRRMKIILWIHEPTYVAFLLTEEKKVEDLIKELAPTYRITFDIYYE